MITLTLDKCLHEMGLSMNKLAIESDARPNTVFDIAKGKAQRIDLETLNKLLQGLNRIAINRGIDRRFDISDLIQYEMDWIQQEMDIDIGDNDQSKETQIGSNYNKDHGLFDTGIIDTEK